MNNIRLTCFQNAKRIVIKLGSNVLTEDNGLNIKTINSISKQISKLKEKGLEVILVSSGAMASGIKKMKITKRPTMIPKRQAIAAIGQAGLILEYEKAFEKYHIKVAQLLLTASDLSNRQRYLNARNTLNTLLSWKVIPVINENDSVVIEEIKFGDNDNLSAMITLLLDADILLNLTDIDGLYTKDPRVNKDVEFIPVISSINDNIKEFATGIAGPLGTGGMMSKIKAAQKITSAGIPMIIARGTKDNIITDLFEKKEYGTFFVPKKHRLNSRKCWIAYNLKPKGNITIDKGAEKAIIHDGKSILAIGIKDITGEFGVGTPVTFSGLDNQTLGIGLVNYNSKDIRQIKGLSSSQIKNLLGSRPFNSVIHRDNLVITDKNIL